MATGNELFDINKAVEEYSEKKGYTEGVTYYYKLICDNQAVKHSEFYDLVKEYGAALKEFRENESLEALKEMNTIFPKFYQDGVLPDVFVVERLKMAFDNISEYMMHLRKIFNLDFYL